MCVFVCVCQCSAAYLEAASFGGVQDEELFEQVLTVRGHVERNPVFTTQHALSQFLVKDNDRVNSRLEEPTTSNMHTILFFFKTHS